MRAVRTQMIAVVLVVATATSFAVVAGARTTANGLPAYTSGYQKWPKLNKKPITTPGAHDGIKNVYASKRKVGTKYPNGAVIVKSIRQPGEAYAGEVAVMRKVKGRWQFVEYTRPSAAARYTVLAQGKLCLDCHVQARANDYVFTKR